MLKMSELGLNGLQDEKDKKIGHTILPSFHPKNPNSDNVKMSELGFIRL